jgi:hypothetical protein
VTAQSWRTNELDNSTTFVGEKVLYSYCVRRVP